VSPALLREPGRCHSFFHQADVVHHSKATVQNLKNLVDLHPAIAVAVEEDRVTDDDSAFRVNQSDAHFSRWSPGFWSKIAFVTANVAALLDTILCVVGDTISAVFEGQTGDCEETGGGSRLRVLWRSRKRGGNVGG
jgi:hypothetical protein